jgi:metal-dependent hydrolase (beta-lactamase superfamily II)
LCLARSPNEYEKQQLLALLDHSQHWYSDHVEDAQSLIANMTIEGCAPAEIAAWVATARILINLDEFITRE